jgi:thiamine-monophosphate kinase
MASPDPRSTLADVGEFGLISMLTERFPQDSHVLLGPGDDAAVVAVPDGRVVVSSDMYVDGRHFRRDWASAADIGHRVAAANLSDLNAMGGTATALTVSLAAPADLDLSWVLELAEGIAEEAGLVGACVVGGDLSSAGTIVVAVTALGSVEGAPVTRGGARPGDVVAIAGRQGWAAAGLAVLGRGFRSPRVLVDAFRRPEPPYRAGRSAAAAGATSMIDVSDGLLADLGHIAEASHVAIDVIPDSLEISEPLQAVASATGADPLTFVLGGGEDHALVATFPADQVLPPEWNLIGSVAAGEEGVTVAGAAYEGPTGHTHF